MTTFPLGISSAAFTISKEGLHLFPFLFVSSRLEMTGKQRQVKPVPCSGGTPSPERESALEASAVEGYRSLSSERSEHRIKTEGRREGLLKKSSQPLNQGLKDKLALPQAALWETEVVGGREYWAEGGPGCEVGRRGQ